MKRQIVAVVSGVAACVAVLGLSAVAGAAPVRHDVARGAAPTIKITPSANLKAGDKVKVTGSGWPKSTSTTKVGLLIAECNFDGDGPGVLSGSCDTKALGKATVTTSGTFSTTFTVVGGTMKAGKSDNDCAQTKAQAEHAVQCIIGAAKLGTGLSIEKFAYGSIFFSAPKPTVKVTKSASTYSVKVTEPAGYTSSSVGGFEVIGSKGKSTKCQGSHNNTINKSGWPGVNLPACTSFAGESVSLSGIGKAVTVTASATSPGSFIYTFTGVKAGTYTLKALGKSSGEMVTATVHVG